MERSCSESEVREAILEEGLRAWQRGEHANARYSDVAIRLEIAKREVVRVAMRLSEDGLLRRTAIDLYRLTEVGASIAESEIEMGE
ncbi:MAG: hypothetical protein IT350_07530 [Deltaproteobacteria bacterium]|nr:hypothetical protein [Deltaproteobacteria bacterium]